MLVTCQLTSRLRPQLPLLISSGYGIALVVGEVEDGVEAPGEGERGKNSGLTIVDARRFTCDELSGLHTEKKFRKLYPSKNSWTPTKLPEVSTLSKSSRLHSMIK